MANIKSQEKRNRQNERRREKNSQVRSSVRTAAKKVVNTIESKDSVDIAILKTSYAEFVKKIDTAVQKGLYHKNTAARKKSRLAKRINSISASV